VERQNMIYVVATTPEQLGRTRMFSEFRLYLFHVLVEGQWNCIVKKKRENSKSQVINTEKGSDNDRISMPSMPHMALNLKSVAGHGSMHRLWHDLRVALMVLNSKGENPNRP
ncbi:hypothetical protein HAX54_019383, partial [Datura stramonium]|nr:hypothetical protein [Datura stramonium]